MEDLGINLPGLITQVISFLILLFVLSKLLYKPVIKMLDDRADRIKESLSAAEKAKEDAASSAEKIEKELISARQEGQKIIDQAKQFSEDFKEKERSKALEEIENLIEKSKIDLEKETRVAINELRKNFSSLVLEAAEKVVNKEIDDNTHNKLIEKVLKENVK
ncbi:MAG: ATP synthase F0 subunit B [Dehalococcoidia bacterium]|nr:ATP synthase F0 subunit B [Dehalococcoidia bacterium]